MSVSTRPLDPADYDRWKELWRGYLAFYESSVPDAVTQATWSRLVDPTQEPHGFAAIGADGKIVGIAHYVFHRSTWTDRTYCYLEDLFVDPDIRKSGVGQALIAAVEAAARTENCARMYLNTQDFNATARGLYDKVMTKTPFIQYRKPLG